MTESQGVIFLRCNEFMETRKGSTSELSFYNENHDKIKGIIHAWPLTPDTVELFLEEERRLYPNRNYYSLTPNIGWRIYALNWGDIDRYVSNLGQPFSGWNGIKPKLEKFVVNKHVGRLIMSNDNKATVALSHQVIFTPEEIVSFD